MNIRTLRKQLAYYQRQMVATREQGDMVAYEVYRDHTRWLSEEIRQKEKTAQDRTA